MTLSVLISCMNQTDYSIVQRTNIQTDCVVVNQCDIDKYEEYSFVNRLGKECLVKFISTKERGLSRSRNMAIDNATSDICLICDDDEVLSDDYEETILSGYATNKSSNIIVFEIIRSDKGFICHKSQHMGIKKILQTSSVQITFNRSAVLEKQIKFDIQLGSGTGNGAGEENKFLMDCRRCGLSIYYIPGAIGSLMQTSESQWFTKYDKKYFFNHGWSSRKILGAKLSIAYIIYYVVTKRSLYRKDISTYAALLQEFKGWNSNKH